MHPLNSQQRKLLILLNKHSSVPFQLLDFSNPETTCDLCDYLVSLGYASYDSNSSIKITEYGKTYLSERRKSNFRFYLSTSIAIFAAIGAYREELLLLLQELVKLAK